MKLTILSVDWDYFFPDPTDFDWGHSEESALFYETIWDLRPGNRHLFNHDLAIDVFHPDMKLLDGFWQRTVEKSEYLYQMWLVESHKTMGDILAGLRKSAEVECWNFDQHHDLYGPEKAKLNCGNWAKPLARCKRHAYHVVYPPWRKNRPDAKVKGNFDARFEHPGLIQPHIIFCCRSSCWTPPWADQHWLKFIGELQGMYGKIFHFNTAPFVMGARKLNEKMARENAEAWLRTLDSMQKKSG